MEPVTFKLSAPLTTHKGVLDALTLKVPKGKSYTKHGSPFTTIREGDLTNPRLEFRFNDKAMFGFLSDMTEIEVALLENIEAVDVQPLYWKVVEILNGRPTQGSTGSN